jgi:predicted transport protein
MRYETLQKQINRLDNDIDSMGVAKKYLSNIDEINDVIKELNEKRIGLANELYFEDHSSYAQCCIEISNVIDRPLGQEQQAELLETIKEIFGRKSPNVSKKSYGLNAWLKELDIEYKWIEKENEDWATLIISGFGLHE